MRRPPVGTPPDVPEEVDLVALVTPVVPPTRRNVELALLLLAVAWPERPTRSSA